MASDPNETTQSLLLTPTQAALLLELAHRAAWAGTKVRQVAPVIAQLESIAPPAASSRAPAGPGIDTGSRGV